MGDQAPSETSVRLTRRLFLKTIVSASLLALWTLWETEDVLAEPRKVSKAVAHYRSRPDDGKMCMNCVHFLPTTPGMKRMTEHMSEMGGRMPGMEMMGPPMMGRHMMGRCEVVEGPVSPMGYCRLYSPVHRA